MKYKKHSTTTLVSARQVSHTLGEFGSTESSSHPSVSLKVTPPGKRDLGAAAREDTKTLSYSQVTATTKDNNDQQQDLRENGGGVDWPLEFTLSVAAEAAGRHGPITSLMSGH